MRARGWQLALAIALVVAIAAMPLAGCTTGDDNGGNGGEPYKIGVVLSTSGTYAGLGEAEQNAINMEVAKINEAGGVHGRDIEVIIKDDATDDAQALAATEELIEQEGVIAIIGTSGTGQSMAMRTAIEEAMIPQISMAGGTAIASPVSEWVFQTPMANTQVVPFLLEYIKGQGITKIALIADSGGFGKDGVAVIQSNVQQFGIEIVANESFAVGDTKMETQLSKIKGSGAEALVMWTAGAEAPIVLQNAQQLDLGMPIFGSHGNARVQLIEGAGDAAEGFIFPAGKVLVPELLGEGTEAFDVVTDFTSRYEEEFGAAPSTFAGHGFDALYLITEAIGRLDEEFTSEELRNEIEKTSGFVGIDGTYTYSATDHNGLTASDLAMYKVEGGTWVPVE